MSVKRKDDDVLVDDSDWSLYTDLRKNVLLTEAKIFHSRDLQPHACSQVLIKLLYLLSMGEALSSDEAIELFFAVTKLFQSHDVHLRRLVYLTLKALKVDSDSSVIVISCLSKDMTSKNDLYRAHAVRVLAQLMDTSMIQQMERFLKQALVDRNPYLQSSMLCAAQHMNTHAPDVVKRWLNETQEAMSGKNKMVQYHALALLYRMRAHDKLALSKVVTSLARHHPSIQSSPMAQLLHVRMMSSLLSTLPAIPPAGLAAATLHQELLKALQDALHASPFLVMYEAARALVRLDYLVPVAQLVPALSVIQEMLTSTVPCHRFAAVKTLSEVVVKHPALVTPCVNDLEHCIHDSNRSIATLAITTLLKTGVESNVDRLMKSLTGFMAELSDEYKIVLVDAMKALCLKFPHKFPALLKFLSDALREEGGYLYKKAIVDAVLVIITEIHEATELLLEQFCELIEDCEFSEISVRILHVLGERGPTTSNPNKYIRYIFNRVILETASVRCAAVSSLARFGLQVPALTDHMIVLLQRCLTDNDDEVRDRAIFNISLLQAMSNSNGSALLSNTAPVPVSNASATSTSTSVSLSSTEPAVVVSQATLIVPSPAASAALKSLFAQSNKALPPLYQLEQSLLTYLSCPTTSAFFSLQKDLVSVANDPDTVSADAETNAGVTDTSFFGTSSSSPLHSHAVPLVSDASSTTTNTQNTALALFRSIPDLASLGPIFKSSAPVSLTEAESEYVVFCVKHILPSHVVFQFNITNNMDTQQLEQVRVEMECENDQWEEELSIPEPKIPPALSGVSFVAFKRASTAFVSGAVQCTLHFKVRDVEDGEVIDGAGEGQSDEYQLEEIEVTESDFMQLGANLGFTEFKRQWEEMSDKLELTKKYSLGLDNLQAAVAAVIDLLGMQPCEQSGQVQEGATSHAINLTGLFFTDIKVLARAGFKLDAKHGVTLKIVVRSNNERVNQMLANAIR